jgi:hypothetical protein
MESDLIATRNKKNIPFLHRITLSLVTIRVQCICMVNRAPRNTIANSIIKDSWGIDRLEGVMLTWQF